MTYNVFGGTLNSTLRCAKNDWLKRLVTEMTYYVSTVTLNSTHSFIPSGVSGLSHCVSII